MKSFEELLALAAFTEIMAAPNYRLIEDIDREALDELEAQLGAALLPVVEDLVEAVEYILVDYAELNCRCDLTDQEPVKDPPRWPDDDIHLAWADVYRLFGRVDAEESLRWTSSADSEEYLNLVTYLVERSSQ